MDIGKEKRLPLKSPFLAVRPNWIIPKLILQDLYHPKTIY